MIIKLEIFLIMPVGESMNQGWIVKDLEKAQK